MARNMYGATSADFTITSGGRVIPGAVLTLWSARSGGTQITDLLDVDSVACTTVTSAADGSVVYYGPNDDKTVHWADSGQGSRVAIRPTDITGDPPVMSIGTVGTGTAAASLTGTSEAPVLNLTLPSAGTNGVNTAAIQNDAVTADKIAADAVGSSEIAANAVGSSELADNAVDTAAIADSAVTPAKLATTGRFVFPTGAANGYGFASGAVHLSGTGAPEGAITAAPGSTWLQTDSTTDVKGWLRWVKASGTGNAGWIAGPEADTGKRNIASLLVNSWDTTMADGAATLRRTGSMVALRLFVKNGTAARVTTLPAGFRPTASHYVTVTKYNGNLIGSVWVAEDGKVDANSAGVGFPALADGFYVTVTFDTTGSWPSSLPGS